MPKPPANLTVMNRISNFSDRYKKKQTSLIALLLLACLGVGFGGGWLGANYNQQNPSKSTASVQRQVISNESDLIASIASDVGQSVVSVDVSSQAQTQDFFGFGQTINQQSAGTGIIISSDGVVVTNRHVVPKGTTSVSVVLSDGTRLDNVEVIGRTNDSDSLDVAFLKIKDKKGKTLVPATIGDSAKMKVGDRVVAIGNALGQYQNTVTSGVLSGYGRDVVAGDQSGNNTETLSNLFQTDAAINEGNSGGPLVNIKGEVIGINTAIAGGAQNIGFSIPINDIKGLITSVLGTGKLEKPYLGVRYISITDDYAYQYNLNVKRGAYILPSTAGSGPSILDNSPASKAGLKEKDIITQVNNIKIDDKTSLSSALGQFKVGVTVTLSVTRDGKQIKVPVKLEAQTES